MPALAILLKVLEEHLEAWIKNGGVRPYPAMDK
jgi:hypothetical protein